jgi:phosphoglycolate phosphatase
MAAPRKTELVIFDLDGTLVDSRQDIADSINAGLTAVGGQARPIEQLYCQIGVPLDDIFRELLPGELHHRVADASERYRSHYFEGCSRTSTIYPGVEECLGALKNLTLAIATTKRTFQAVRVAELMGLFPHFDLVHGTDGIPYKPDPAVLFQVLERLDKSPDAAWMVGDTVHDVRAGKAAGLRTCAVTYGIGDRDDLVAESPDLLLGSLAELPGLIGTFPVR